jgi:Uncharacterized conserved protein (COG2071)
VRLALRVRDLVLASWTLERENVERVLYPSLEPAQIEGRHVVSVAAFRYTSGRVGGVPVPPFSQLNVRTYVHWEGEPAVFFLRAYVTLPGLAGVVFGAPYRPARLRFRPGRVEAPGVGLSLAYRVAGSGAPEPFGRHELGLFEAAGLRGFRILRAPAAWHGAQPTAPARVDLLLALGLEIRGDPTVSYAPEASFETDVPPRKLA